MEACQAEVMHDLFDAERWIKQPTPGQPGDDEGHRERVEKDRAQQALAAHPLIDQRGQQEAQHQGHSEMNRAPKIAMLVTETCQRSLATRLLYCRSPTNTELGSIRELVNEIQIVQPIAPQ